MKENEDKSFLPPRSRQLSRFLCQEMLYDYVTQNLDQARKQSVESYLSEHAEIQEELNELQASLDYCHQLSETQLSEPFLQVIREARSPFMILIQRMYWHNWPDFAKWGTEALVISCLVAVLAVFIPWNKALKWIPHRSKDIILSEVVQQSMLTQKETVELPVIQGQNKEPEEKAPAVVVQAEKKPEPTLPSPEKVVEKKTAPPVEQKKVNADEELGQQQEADSSQTVKKSPGGFIYRAFLSTDAIDATTQDLIAAIEALGGVKAGQVDLGWRKANGSYFHFSMPDSNYEALVQKFNAIGPVRIYKEPHWRVMQQGQIRIILFVEDRSLKN